MKCLLLEVCVTKVSVDKEVGDESSPWSKKLGIAEVDQEGETMTAFDVMRIAHERGDQDRRIGRAKSREISATEPMHGTGPEDKLLKVEIFNLESDNSSRSDQGSVRTSRGDEVVKQTGKRRRPRPSEPEDLETPQRTTRSTKCKEDSVTKPAEKMKTDIGSIMKSPMSKQVKFENGCSINQSG